jgi:thymidylate kinase
MFLSFSGIDGAGKSTQIQALRGSLTELGLRVRIIPFWDEIASLTRLREIAGHNIFKGDKGIGTPSAPVERRDKNVRTWPMTCFRLFLYLLDVFSTRRATRRLLSSDFDIIIFDRYIYDELANLNLRNPLVRAYTRLILKLVPSLDVSYLLDADPVEARVRKPEYPIEFIHINRQSYKDLSQLVAGMICIPPMEVEDVHRLVLVHALKMLTPSGEKGESIQNSTIVESNL